jgi:hypothetical protein
VVRRRKMEAAVSSETLLFTYQSVWSHIPEDEQVEERERVFSHIFI